MDEAKAQVTSEMPSAVPEMPEDVAILFSWANMPGARYRDFSASRREYRAQQRARIAEQQQQAELEKARELEAAAQREFEEAERIREKSRNSDFLTGGDWDEKSRSRELVRRTEEQALRERQEARERQRAAEDLRVQAQRARSEMLEARQRAEEQATRYAEAATQHHERLHPETSRTLPGEITDPYYYTGQVDPAYFASTPGVRTAQATRISTERRTYVYPIHPGSDDHDSGSLQSYRSSTRFAPSPTQSFRSVRQSARERLSVRDAEQRSQPSELVRSRNLNGPFQDTEAERPGDEYYDGKPPATTATHVASNEDTPKESQTAERDVLIRPVSRTPEPVSVPFEEAAEARAETFIAPVGLPQLPGTSAAPAAGEELWRNDTAEHKFHDETPLLESYPQSVVTESLPPDVSSPAQLSSLGRDEVVVPAFLTPRDQTYTGIFHDEGVRPDVPPPVSPRLDREIQSEKLRDLPLKKDGPPSWLDAPGQEVQRFLPPSLRSVSPVPKEVPSPPIPARGTPQNVRTTFSRRTDHPLRYNRNLDRGRNHAAISGAFDRRKAAQLVADAARRFAEQPSGEFHAPDTLQQSRERVASRWFALKGMMDPLQEVAGPPPVSELSTPTLCVLSLSGGVGKTCLVATLGRAFSSMGEKVLLADTNAYGMLPYYFGARGLQPGTVRTFTPQTGNLDAPVLLQNYDVEGIGKDETAQAHLVNELGRRARSAQRVLVDLGPNGSWLNRLLASAHPWVLVPVAPDTNSVVSTQAMERMFEGLVDAHGQSVRPYYVLNQYDSSLPLHLDVREVLRRSLGDRLLPVTLRRSPAVAEALAEGMTVIDYAPAAPVTKDYINLATWLRSLSAPASDTVRGVRWREK